MPLVFVSFLAGILSVLAPCIIGMLPLLVSRSNQQEDDGPKNTSSNLAKIVRICIGLSVSIIVFSLLLKSSTLLIFVPSSTWKLISGGIIILFGLSALFPDVWEKIAMKLRLQQFSSKGQQKAISSGGKIGDYLLGSSLGPIFSACSPTYLLIIAVILPANFISGLVYLVSFVAGLSVAIILLALLGGKAISKFGWGINPKGIFKRTLGVIFIVFGILIITGADKQIQTYFVENDYFKWQTSLEESLMR